MRPLGSPRLYGLTHEPNINRIYFNNKYVLVDNIVTLTPCPSCCNLRSTDVNANNLLEVVTVYLRVLAGAAANIQTQLQGPLLQEKQATESLILPEILLREILVM